MNYVITCKTHEVADRLLGEFIWTISVTEDPKVLKTQKFVYAGGDTYKFLSGSNESRNRYFQGRRDANLKVLPDFVFEKILNEFKSTNNFGEELQNAHKEKPIFYVPVGKNKK